MTALIVAWLCVGGGVLVLTTAVNIFLLLEKLRSSKLANPPRTTLLYILLPLLGALVLSLGMTAWHLFEGRSSQREEAAGWMMGSVALWAGLAAYTFLVNYPVPSLAHHTDKFILLCLLMFAWSLCLWLAPANLAHMLRLRYYTWLRVAFINLVVFMVVGEVLVRAADPVLARSGLFGDKHSPAYLKAHMPVVGSIGFTNSQGFRDRERTFARDDSFPRILALGDSFTWGAGVSYDDAFVTLVEWGLQTNNAGAEIINLGVPAWGPHEELHLLKHYGIRFAPDLVMVNFFIGNDIQNKRTDDLNLLQTMVVAGRSYYVHSSGNWVHDTVGPDRWYLYHNLNYLVQVGRHRLFADAGMEGPIPLLPRDFYLAGIHERDDVYLSQPTPFFEFHWTHTTRTLLEMRDFLRSHRIPMVLVLLPDHVQLDRDLQNEYLTRVGASARHYEFDKPQRLLLAWGDQNSIPVIDLLPVFEAAGNPTKFYFVNDIHWNRAGHHLAASAIMPALRARFPQLHKTRGQNTNRVASQSVAP